MNFLFCFDIVRALVIDMQSIFIYDVYCYIYIHSYFLGIRRELRGVSFCFAMRGIFIVDDDYEGSLEIPRSF